MHQEARREQRYRIPDSSKINAILTHEGQQQSVRLLDLSQSGLRLRIADSVPHGATLRVAISAVGTDFNADFNAKVTWLEANHDGWLVGCSMHPSIPAEALNDWVQCGLIERRRDMRRPISFHAEAKTNLACEFQQIQIVNVSAGGFCAVVEESVAKPDDRLLVRIDKDIDGEERLLQAKVAWVEETVAGGQSLGCNFLTKSDYAKLQAVAEKERVGNPLFQKLKRHAPGTRWSLIATGLLCLIVVLQQIFWSA